MVITLDLVGTEVGLVAWIDGTVVGRGDIELLVVGCTEVKTDVGGPVLTVGDGLGRFVDGIDDVGLLV